MRHHFAAHYWRALIKLVFKSHNIKHALLIPSGLLGIVFISMGLLLLMSLIFLLNGTVFPTSTWTGLFLLVALAPLGLSLGTLCGIALMGYYWNLVATLQNHGLDADVPAWTQGQWQRHLQRGWHMAGYCMILVLFGSLFLDLLANLSGYTANAEMIETPTIGDFKLIQFHDTNKDYLNLFQSAGWTSLMMLTSLTLALPFLLGPLYYNAHTQDFCTLFKNLRASLGWASTRYWWVFGVSLFIHTFLAGLLGALILILGLTGVGLLCIPFLVIFGLTLCTVLYTWAFTPLKVNRPASVEVFLESDA